MELGSCLPDGNSVRPYGKSRFGIRIQNQSLICLVDGSINHLNDYQINKAISGEFNKKEIIRLSKEMAHAIEKISI